MIALLQQLLRKAPEGLIHSYNLVKFLVGDTII